MSDGRRWALAYALYATIVGACFIAVNAPFQVPDEVGHYWRAAAIANGSFAPAASDGRAPAALVPGGVRQLVATLWVDTAGKNVATVGLDRIRAARAVELAKDAPRSVTFPAYYTPLPYLPEAAVLWAGYQLDARPLTTFYAARLANLLMMVVLVSASMLIAPQAAWAFAAAGSLPMTLHLAGSFSSDAFTFGAASLALALAITPRKIAPARYAVAITAAGLVLALCKPVYFAIPLIALWNRNIRPGRRAVTALALVLGIGVGLAASAVVARRATFNMRGDASVDSTRQLASLRADPLRFVSTATNFYRTNQWPIRHELVGRLGWLDVPLPDPLSTFAQLAFLVAALSAKRAVVMRQRIAAVAAALSVLFLVALSMYLTWTPVGAATVDGIQGRYFIPIVAIVALVLQLRHTPRLHWSAVALIVISVALLDAIGVYRLAVRYF